MKRVSLFFSAIVFLVSCQNQLLDKPDSKSPAGGVTDYNKKALSLSKNLVLLSQMYPQTRDLGNVVSPAKYFEKLLIKDKNGNPLLFSQFTPEERNVFTAVWAQKSADQWTAHCAGNPEYAVELESQSDAVEAALQSLPAQRSAGDDYLTFLDRFNPQIEKKRSAGNERLKESLGTQNPQTQRSVDPQNAHAQEILKALKSVYRKGRILTMSGGPSLLSNLLGHSSIFYSMTEADFVETDANKITSNITSWGKTPKGEVAPWSGFEGVQPEPLAVWTNTVPNLDTGNSRVKVHKVGRSLWVWDWWNSGNQFFEASGSEYDRAADFAASENGKPYNYNFVWKYDTENYYCSSLVWRAWKNIDSDQLDLDWSWWDTTVPPSDLDGSDRTQTIYEVVN